MPLLPPRWSNQIGHIGFIDGYLKIQQLQGIEARPLLFGEPRRIANAYYLSLWRRHIDVATDYRQLSALLPYARLFDESCNAVLKEGRFEEWLGVAARALAFWDEEGREPLIGIPESDLARGYDLLRGAGLPDGAWWVGVHVRDGGFHRENERWAQDIRNADISTYLPAMEEIRKRGGWVVRLGDPAMPPLPPMPNVLDYPHSPLKSEVMDIFLCARARFVIGCTSGLIHVPISFHTPTLATNCILTFPQPWNSRVKFLLKPIWDPREERYLTLDELIDVDFRSKTNADRVFTRLGLEARRNSAEELREATIEMLDEFVDRKPREIDAVWKRRLGDQPHFFGGGTPAHSFFEKYREILF